MPKKSKRKERKVIVEGCPSSGSLDSPGISVGPGTVGSKDIDARIIGTRIPKLSLWQKIKLRVLGYVYLYEEKRSGWTAKLPIYLVKCKKHGNFIDYPHGYREYFSCPKCLD